jgi:hypothetical protein
LAKNHQPRHHDCLGIVTARLLPNLKPPSIPSNKISQQSIFLTQSNAKMHPHYSSTHATTHLDKKTLKNLAILQQKRQKQWKRMKIEGKWCQKSFSLSTNSNAFDMHRHEPPLQTQKNSNVQG